MNFVEFKDKIRTKRLDLGLTLNDVAKLVGVSSPTIQRYESGEIKNVRRDKIKLLADALQVTPAYLMDWEEDEGHSAPTKNIKTIAAHAIEDLTEAEQEKVLEYVQFLKAQRK